MHLLSYLAIKSRANLKHNDFFANGKDIGDMAGIDCL
jgi:hypothetical protein